MANEFLNPVPWLSPLSEALAQFRSGRPLLLRDDTDAGPRTYLVAAEDVAPLSTVHAMTHASAGLLCLLTTCRDIRAIRLNPELSQEFKLGLCIGRRNGERETAPRPDCAKAPIIPVTVRLSFSSRPRSTTRCALALACLAGNCPAVYFCQTAQPLPRSFFHCGKNRSNPGQLHAVSTRDILASCSDCRWCKCESRLNG